MARFTEPLWGGLWTADDPAFLEPGQLSAMQNAVYDPNQNALIRATGRSQFGIVSGAQSVDGLRDIQFDNGDHYLVAMIPTAYFTATVDDTGTFASASAITGGSYLERVHYRNRYFLLNGVTASADAINTNKAFYLSATAAGNPLQVRQHGMLPVIAAPASAAVASTFSQTVTGYYEYWTTEVAKLTQDGAELSLESAFATDTNPTTVFVSSTGMAAQISAPQVRNVGFTTHWNIYRSPKKDKEGDKKFPSGFLIGQVSTATAFFTDTIATASASSFPSSVNTSAAFFSWASASSVTSDNGVYASATVPALPVQQQQGIYGFNLGGFSGSVKGIQVEVQGYISSVTTAGGLPIEATIGVRDANTGIFRLDLSGPFSNNQKIASKSGIITATGSGSPQTITLGTPTDRWVASDKAGFADTDFGSSFMVRLSVSKANYSLGVDYVKLYAYYSAAVDGTVQYPAVVYTFGDISAQVSKNHPPPSASTGDLFEDMLVLNDVSNPALIRYSFAGEPEYFPPTYFIDFETTENDRVTNIKVVNNVLVVGLETSLWRVNSLPTERNAEFKRDIESISRTYGCVNEMCACVFSKPGYGDRLAFVSNNGIHETDGFSFDTYTDGINWRNHISTTNTSTPIALINDPDKQELLFYYRNDGLGDETYQCLHLHYASGHLINGRPKISGPVHMRNAADAVTFASLESAWPVARASGETSIYLGYGGATAAGGGYVYRETGTTIPALENHMAYVTRRMYQAEMGNEWALNNLYAYSGSYSGTPQIDYFIEKTKTNDTGVVTSGSKRINLGGQRLHRVTFSELSEGMRVSAVVTAGSYSVSQHVIEGEGWGDEDSGR